MKPCAERSETLLAYALHVALTLPWNIEAEIARSNDNSGDSEPSPCRRVRILCAGQNEHDVAILHDV